MAKEYPIGNELNASNVEQRQFNSDYPFNFALYSHDIPLPTYYLNKSPKIKWIA